MLFKSAAPLERGKIQRGFIVEYWMTSWLWLLPLVIAVIIWVLRDARRGIDLGSVSAQWLHEHRQSQHD